MSNNILQWNPGAANQEDDTTYEADAQRTGGAPNGVEFPSATANKLFYQLSTFCAAFAQSLSNKSYNISDASISVLEGVLANVVTFADLKTNLLSISFSTTPVFDASVNNGFDFVMAGNVASSTLTGQQIGQIITFVIKQGAVAYVFAPPTNINEWIPISTVSNSVSVQQFIVRADGTIWPVSTEVNVLLSQIANLLNPTYVGATNGYKIDPTTDIIEQWGYVPTSNGTFSFPIPFTTSVYNFIASSATAGGSFSDPAFGYPTSLSTFFAATKNSAGGGNSNYPVSWRAIGK